MIYYEKDGIVIRTAVESDLAPVCASIRRQDAEEVLAAGEDASVEAALARSFAASTFRLAAVRNGVPVAVFGVVPVALGGTRAVVWLLGAEGLSKIPKTFTRLSRSVIAMFLEMYPELWNQVDCRYVKTIRWLESCGAKFMAPTPAVRGGQPFTTFIIRRA